ncbi:MAG: hypothetical protein LH491_09680 [Pseudoxanthomonas sp.]|nr:hypothetical protein [Pseudoxanthomonas sp.]
MRLPTTAGIFITAALVFAAIPAHAQRQSLADRVASLEQLPPMTAAMPNC